MKTTGENPFHELFVTDSAPAEDFVRYFSPYLVPHTLELFNEGNVVLKGTQGCGKSMLLKLFQPEIRVAYARHNEKTGKRIEFPVPLDLRNFIGAGINLSKSGLLDIAQLLSSRPNQAEFQRFTALFSDLLNYWLLRDLLKSLVTISSNADVFNGLVCNERFDQFAKMASGEDCWFGYFDSCSTFLEMEQRVNERIIKYRRWMARNDSELDPIIESSKTSIGEPLSRIVGCLKACEVINQDTPVFLRIDQMEELWHREGHQAKLSQNFREVINRAIGNRDLRVSFRIGTRRYSWDHELSMPGGRKIEEHRDYVVVDLDGRLRRNEDQRGWLFKAFASDVFAHRINDLSTQEGERDGSLLFEYFGKSPTPQKLVETLIVNPPEDPQKLLKLDDQWSDEWREYIHAVYERHIPCEKGQRDYDASYQKDPLNSLLISAWGMQTGGVVNGPQRRSQPLPQRFPPWTQWWEKERIMMAVMQLVVRHQKTLFWWGAEKVLSLSASNITIFLSICREVWDQWLRRSGDGSDKSPDGVQSRPSIGWKIQAVAINNVSKNWHRNFARQPGRPGGDVRMRFVDELGNWLRRRMVADSPMSYPGANGFSLKASELQSNPGLAALLEEAVGWGDLYEVDHTTKISKEKYRDPRKKYYLNPILSPHFQIPDAHTKEPLYRPASEIVKLAAQAKALSFIDPVDVSRSDKQTELPF